VPDSVGFTQRRVKRRAQLIWVHQRTRCSQLLFPKHILLAVEQGQLEAAGAGVYEQDPHGSSLSMGA
jgi:hypothetical protein